MRFPLIFDLSTKSTSFSLSTSTKSPTDSAKSSANSTTILIKRCTTCGKNCLCKPKENKKPIEISKKQTIEGYKPREFKVVKKDDLTSSTHITKKNSAELINKAFPKKEIVESKTIKIEEKKTEVTQVTNFVTEVIQPKASEEKKEECSTTIKSDEANSIKATKLEATNDKQPEPSIVLVHPESLKENVDGIVKKLESIAKVYVRQKETFSANTLPDGDFITFQFCRNPALDLNFLEDSTRIFKQSKGNCVVVALQEGKKAPLDYKISGFTKGQKQFEKLISIHIQRQKGAPLPEKVMADATEKIKNVYEEFKTFSKP